VTNLTDAPKAKVPIIFARRLYLLNCVIGATAYRTRAYRSSLVDSGSITWDTTNDWLVFDDIIVGGALNGENMFVGCENSCWIFTKADEKYQVSTTGCVSHESIASYGRWTFRAARDGVYAFDGASDTKISLPIQEYWDAIIEANLSEIQAKVLGHHLYVYIGDVTVDGRALANVLWDYDILQNNWNRMGLADEAKHLHTYVTTSGKRLFMGNDDGEVFQMFESESQNTGTFTSFIETPWFYGSGPKIVDDFKELWAHGELLSALKVKYKVDTGGWQSAGELTGFSDLVRFNASGKRIKFLLEETSKNNLYEVQSLEVGFLPKFSESKESKE